MDSLIIIPEIMRKTSDLLRRIGSSPEKAAKLLAAVTEQPKTHEPIRALKAAAGLEDDSVERLLLWYAAQQQVPKVDALPIADDVKRLLGKELRALPASNLTYAAGSYLFTWAARIATFRRFPAGVMDWDLSGIPRSWLLKAPLWDMPSLLSVVARQLRGVRPCFFLHVAPKPRNRALVIEKEVIRAYYRMTRSLELQPGIKAIIGAAWFYDPAALKDNAHFEHLHRPFRDYGGYLTTIGPAPADAGFLDGNAKRRQQYEAGQLQYRIGLAIWPRRAALEWAAAHPELDQRLID